MSDSMTEQELIDAATEFLADRNLAPEDYLNPVEAATEIAEQEAIAESMPGDGVYVEFDGDDFCEGCEGWDGESRRCYCGNRRIYWEAGWGCTFQNMYVFPQVY